MARAQLNTNGSTPLADTAGGAAGTVTGTERKWVQDVTTAISLAVSGIINAFVARALTVRPSADAGGNAIVTGVNAANSILWTISQAGRFSGSADSLTSGQPARTKLDAIGTVISATVLIDTGVANGSYTSLGTISLAAGTWLISFAYEATSGGTLNQVVRIRNQTAAQTLLSGTLNYSSHTGRTHHDIGTVAVTLGGTSTIAMEARGAIGGQGCGGTDNQGDQPCTGIWAVRVA